MSLAKNLVIWLQLRLQLTAFAVVCTRSWLCKAAGELAFGTETDRYERDQLGLAVWEAHGCASLPPMVSERGPGHRDVTAVPAVAVPVLHATTGGGLYWTASTCRLPTPLCTSAPHAVGADAVPQPCLKQGPKVDVSGQQRSESLRHEGGETPS
jgi:hypothetical protein